MTQEDSNQSLPATPSFRADDGLMPEIERHAYSQLSAEVGGVLMGTVGPEETSIQGFIPALSASAEQTTLTFTHDVWDDILRMAKEQFPDLSIVGWYHTHPTFGIFLSDYDLFIQQNFFNNPGHFALVIDPVQGLFGWFANTDDGGVQQVVSGETDSGPRRSVEPPAVTGHTRAGGSAKLWGVGFLALTLGATAGASFTLSQTPPDVSQTLAETQEIAEGQALLISELQGELAGLYEHQVFAYAPRSGDTLLSVATHFYESPLSGVRTLQSANGIGSLNQLPAGALLVVPDPTLTFLAGVDQREITWHPLSGSLNQGEPPAGQSESSIDDGADEESSKASNENGEDSGESGNDTPRSDVDDSDDTGDGTRPQGNSE